MISVHRTTLEWVHTNCNVAKEIDRSFEMWKVMDGDQVSLVVGFLVPSLILGWADMWIVPVRLTREVLRARRGLMELARDHFPLMSAHVLPENERFARFFGFKPVRSVRIGEQMLVRMEWQPDFQ